VPDFSKIVLNKKVDLKDLETGNYELYKGLTWRLCSSSWLWSWCWLIPLFLTRCVSDKTISVTEDRFGEHVVVGLRLGGAAQDGTEASKEGVDPVVAHRIAGQIAEQFHAFMEEVGDVLPLDLLRVIDEHELELLIEGMTDIDMDDRTRFTDYGGFKKTDRVIEWF